MNSKKVKVAITTGDPDGIGLEISLKAILKIPAAARRQVFLFRSKSSPPNSIKRLLNSIDRVEVQSLAEALDLGGHPRAQIVDIVSDLSPAHWVEQSAKACLDGHFDCLVTAPLSKPLIQTSGLSDVGHTDILKRICGKPHAHMGFIGKYFSVVLGTGHIPISQVSESWNSHSIRPALDACFQLRSLLPRGRNNLPVGVLGLNPHAGDGGLIGSEESLWLAKEIQRLGSKNRPLLGPLVPDAAFLKQNWPRFSVYLAAYHDQGLIPFKMIHGHGSGVHLTLGLPLKRTSVDHGVAKDIFGKNKADPGSMIEALNFAIRWASKTEE